MPIPGLPKLGTPPAPAPLCKIALEEHFGHPNLFMRDSEGRFETHKEATIGHLGPEYFEVVQNRLLDFDTTRLEAMDEAGVEKVLLSLTTFGIQAITDRAEAQSTARTVNDFLAERVRAHPTVISGWRALRSTMPNQAARELERCITKLGFKGVMVNGYSQVDSPDNLLYLDDERMTPFWEALTALDMPLYIHPRPSHNAAQYEDHPELTGAAWGFAPETATHALRIVYSGVFDRFPTAKLVLGHLGESLPFLAWRIQHGINFSPNGRSHEEALGRLSRGEHLGHHQRQLQHSGAPLHDADDGRRSHSFLGRLSIRGLRRRRRIHRYGTRSARATAAKSLTPTPRRSTNCRGPMNPCNTN